MQEPIKLRCLIVDDESLARKFLEDYIRQFPFLELVASCKNAFEAMAQLQQSAIDLMFLDIQMPGMLGTQLLGSLPEKPMVIFVTAYSNYAVESYELDVVDYLMKPVSLERFSKAVLKAQAEKMARQPQITASAAPSAIEAAGHFFVNVEYALVRIDIPEITHIESMKDYVKIFLQNAAKPILTKSTLKAIEEKLPTEKFMRVHKSYIVQLQKIASLRNHQILIGKYEIPVSQNNMEELMRALRL
ncbi:MAG: response regulator transcription factor [Lewinellaceae bacterium]|nr:response regulator transcription factor [Lewinellaceae bacterium]